MKYNVDYIYVLIVRSKYSTYIYKYWPTTQGNMIPQLKKELAWANRSGYPWELIKYVPGEVIESGGSSA